MRSQITALTLGALGALGGGWLVGVWCFGLVLIALSAGVIAWALLHDDGKGPAGQPQVYAFGQSGMQPDVASFIEKVRAAA